MTPEEILRKHWGYDSFRPLQRDIIDSVLAGRDTLGLLPTGGGKSITFQVPALMLPGVCVVVTPLISLMKDQVDNLAVRSIRAVCLHSGLSRRESELALTRLRLGKAKIVYVSPERLQNKHFLADLRSLEISLLVVDEAHCISQWGYDFRPSYLNISKLRDILGMSVPVLALTASATPEVTADIMRCLHFAAPNVFARSFARDNISYIVRYADFKEETLLRVLRATSGCGIVYVRSRRRSRDIAALLEREGISAAFYHAGLDPEEKELRQNAWKEGSVRIMVATNAFGMGIDKPDVRTVVHFDLPSSLEEYYQEAGRAGRDGLESYAVVTASPRDKATLSRRLSESFPEKDFIRRVYELACNYLDIAVGEGYGTLREFDPDAFCKVYSLPPAQTLSALRLLSRAGYMEYVDDTFSRSRIMVIMNREELYSLSLTPDGDDVLGFLLRSYTGLFADYVEINELAIARGTMLSSERVYQALLYLGRMHVVHFIPRRTKPYIYFPTSRELPRHLVIPLEVYERQRERMERRIGAMRDFAFSSTDCRVEGMLRYFGDPEARPCGKCDVCRARAKRESLSASDAETRRQQLFESILYQAGRHGGTTLPEIIENAPATPDEVIAAVRTLADASRIILTPTRITLP